MKCEHVLAFEKEEEHYCVICHQQIESVKDYEFVKGSYQRLIANYVEEIWERYPIKVKSSVPEYKRPFMI